MNDEVTLSKLDIPFFNLMWFLVKLSIAAIPAAFIVALVWGVLWAVVVGMFGGMNGGF